MELISYLPNNTLNLTWQNKAMQLQKDLNYERQQSQIGYRVRWQIMIIASATKQQQRRF